MYTKVRTKRLAILALATALLALSGVGAVFAHNDNLETSTTCTSGCNLATTTTVTDTINLCVSTTGGCPTTPTPPTSSNSCTDVSTTGQLGTLCVQVFQAPNGCTGSLGSQVSPTALSLTSKTIPGSDDYTGTGSKWNTFYSTLTLSSSTPAGTYAWIVSFTPNSAVEQDALVSLKTCEAFSLTGTFPPTPTVPEFPLGLALLMAIMIPALLAIRSKFATRPSIPSVHA